MNIEQQKQFKLNWLWVLIQPLLLKLVEELGEDVFEWLKDKLGNEGKATTDGGGGNPPVCPPGQIWNPILQRCQDDL